MLESFVSPDEKSISAKVFQDCPKKFSSHNIQNRSSAKTRTGAHRSTFPCNWWIYAAIMADGDPPVFLDQRKFS